MQTLSIVWQRLLSPAGTTCPRCTGTGDEMLRGVEQLRSALQPLGLEPVLETRALDAAAFAQDPGASNQIWIEGRLLEDWLQGQTGRSRCCAECGDQDCRTVEVDGASHEVVPADLVVRAGLLAAAQKLAGPKAAAKACCSGPSACCG